MTSFAHCSAWWNYSDGDFSSCFEHDYLQTLIPLVALVLFNANQNFPFGGTSLLIIVGVGLDTVKQIDAQLQQRHYEGLLR